MTRRIAVVSSLLAMSLLCVSACDREAPAPVDGASSTEPAPAAPDPAGEASTDIDATHVVDHAAPADAPRNFDVRAFAGLFAADGARLVLAPDGTYRYTVDAGRTDEHVASTGTWTVDAGGTGLLLDPDSKDAPDQRFTITSNDALTAAEGGRVLLRDGT